MHIICCISSKLWTRSGSSCCNTRAEIEIVGLLVVALIAAVDSTFLVLPQNRADVVVGSNVTLRCSTNETTKGVVWECVGKCSRRANKTDEQPLIIYINRRIKDPFVGHATVIRDAQEQFDLHIAQIDELDDGRYSCLDRNGIGDIAIAALAVLVPAKPAGILSPGRTTTKSADVAAEASQLTAKNGKFVVVSTEADSAVTQSSTATLVIVLPIVGVALLAVAIIVFLLWCFPDTRHKIAAWLHCTGTATNSQSGKGSGAKGNSSNTTTATTTVACSAPPLPHADSTFRPLLQSTS